MVGVFHHCLNLKNGIIELCALFRVTEWWRMPVFKISKGLQERSVRFVNVKTGDALLVNA